MQQNYNDKESAVLAVHDLFWTALAERDMDTRFAVVADKVTFFGSGFGERATTKEAYRAINERGKQQFPEAFQINFVWKELSVINDVAWVESEVEWIQQINDETNIEKLRNTTILQLVDTKWWIVHVHGSAPDYRLTDGDYMSNEITIKRNNELERQVIERTQALNKSLEELKAAQAQLIQSEKMASLGELTAGIAHEIQNPLNFVNNFSEVSNELIDEMIAELNNNNTGEAIQIAEDVKQNLEKILHHGKRADGIVKGMLQHSRAGGGSKEPTNINTLADEYLRLAYHGLRAKDKSFNATLKTDFDQTIQPVNIVPPDIGRVVLNLITNAFYAVNEKQKSSSVAYEPTVTVSTKSISSTEGEHGIELTVTDNGNGVPQKVIDKIFQPFFTTKPTGQGTGLGLSMSYDIIKAHGGALKVTTKEGEGASFIITLPA